MRRGLASALSKNVVTPLGKGIVPTRVLKLPKKVVGGGVLPSQKRTEIRSTTSSSAVHDWRVLCGGFRR